MYRSSFRSYCSCSYPSCMEDRNSAHVCQASRTCQKPSESHLRLQASSLLQMEGDPRLYSKTERPAFVPSAFGVISRPAGFYVPSTHCVPGQQLFFPFSQTAHNRQQGKSNFTQNLKTSFASCSLPFCSCQIRMLTYVLVTLFVNHVKSQKAGIISTLEE